MELTKVRRRDKISKHHEMLKMTSDFDDKIKQLRL